MVGTGYRNDPDGPNLDSLQTTAVDMQQASNANPSIAVANDPFDPFERLQRKPQGYGRGFLVKILERGEARIAEIGERLRAEGRR
jgi:hypothetical protein